MEFEQYYNTLFRTHCNRFVSQIPDESKYHDDSKRKEIITIQRERLTNKYDYLNFLSKIEYDFFSISLFFTILTDMVWYTHFKQNYSEFQALTKSPKLIGDCRNMCRFHLEPSEIFEIMEFDHKSSKNKVRLEESTLFFEKSIKDFINKYLPMVDSKEFWNLCKERIN